MIAELIPSAVGAMTAQELDLAPAYREVIPIRRRAQSVTGISHFAPVSEHFLGSKIKTGNEEMSD